MTSRPKLIIVGDTHGEFEGLNRILREVRPENAIVAGDFGFWKAGDFDMRPARKWLHSSLENPRTRVYFCDGNHENHARLREFASRARPGRPVRIRQGLWYMPRGCIAEIAGRRILFAGGAYSIDKDYRTPGKTWFPEEDLTPAEARRILSQPGLRDVDMVVSHTCPEECLGDVCRACGLEREWIENDCSEKSLSLLLPALPAVRDWYFGHWHSAAEFQLAGCPARFHLLSMTPQEGCWQEVPG